MFCCFSSHQIKQKKRQKPTNWYRRLMFSVYLRSYRQTLGGFFVFDRKSQTCYLNFHLKNLQQKDKQLNIYTRLLILLSHSLWQNKIRSAGWILQMLKRRYMMNFKVMKLHFVIKFRFILLREEQQRSFKKALNCFHKSDWDLSSLV